MTEGAGVSDGVTAGDALTEGPTDALAEEVAAIAQSVGLEAAACDSVASALRFLAARQWSQSPRILIVG